MFSLSVVLTPIADKGTRLDRLCQPQATADPESSENGQETAVKSEHHDRNGSDSETSSDDDEDEEVCPHCIPLIQLA